MADFKAYKNNVFTSVCNTTAAFMGKIVSSKLLDELRNVKDLVVYYGYHGDSKGNYYQAFNEQELDGIRDFISDKISKVSNNIAVERISTDQAFDDDDVVGAIKRGNVFFAWCSSDERVKHLLTSSNTHLKDY